MTDRTSRYTPPLPSQEARCLVQVVWCDKEQCECFRPECRASGCAANAESMPEKSK